MAGKGASSSFPQGGKKLCVMQVNGLELEKKTDRRYCRGRDKGKILCGAQCCREEDLGLSSHQLLAQE